MTRVIPQIVNTKTALRAAVQALPDTVKIQALLGLDDYCMEYIGAYRDGLFGPVKQ